MHLQSKANLKLCTNLGGALAYHILLTTTMFFNLIIICRSFDLYVVINYQKGGEKCIEHRLRERVCCFCSLLLWWLNFVCFWLLEILCYYLWDIHDHVFDHKLHLCLLDDIILLILTWSFTLLGDECTYSITIILSAPPRCMWHGRVTHEPNSLCICSPKQILKYAQI